MVEMQFSQILSSRGHASADLLARIVAERRHGASDSSWPTFVQVSSVAEREEAEMRPQMGVNDVIDEL